MIKIRILLFFIMSISVFSQTVTCHKYTFQQFLKEDFKVADCGAFDGPRVIFNQKTKVLIRKAFKKHLENFKTRGYYNNNYSKELISFMVKSEGKHFPVYVNIEGIGYRAYFFDNGADYFKDEVARIEHKGKIGFINKKGEVLIEPQYVFVTPFRNGFAKACQKCIFGKEKEHQSINSDHWFLIDKRNKKVEKLPEVVKLPFDIALQKKLLEKPFANTVMSRKKLKEKCEEKKEYCKNFATFYFENTLGFSLDYYKYNYHEMSYSTHVESEGKEKGSKEVLKTFKELVTKDPRVNSHLGLALYMYGEIKKGLSVLKASCDKKNLNACKLHKRLRMHALYLED